jgi:phage-related protein
MGLMGINTKDVEWQSMSATKRLEAMAKAYENLNGSQKVVVATTLASRYQINRADQLFKEINSTTGYYKKSLDSTNDAQAIQNQRMKELTQVLQSNPSRLKQMWVEMQNLMAKAVAPLIPHLVYLMQTIVDLMTKFSNLDVGTQRLIIGFIAFVAVIGPIARYVGAVANMFGLLGAATHTLLKPIGWLGKGIGFLIVPFEGLFKGLSKVRAGISGLAGGIKTDLGHIFKGTQIQGRGPLLTMFAKLPETVRNGLKGAKSAVASGSRGLFDALPAAARGGLTRMVAVFTTGLGGLRGNLIAWVGRLGPWLTGALAAVGRTAAAGMFVGMGNAFGAAVAASKIGQALNAIIVFFLGFRARLAGVVAGIGPAILRGIVWLYTTLPAMIGRGFRAIPGLITRGIGGIATAVSRLFPILVSNFAKIIPWTVRFLTSWWGLAITVALGLIYHFRTQIANAWNSVVAWFAQAVPGIAQGWDVVVAYFNKAVDWIIKAFWKLPDGVTRSIMAVLDVVKTAALQVYEWFSYLNPWAHHSPSLVESVNTGMAAVKKAYGSVGNVGAVFAKAAADLKAFKVIADQLKAVQIKEDTAQIAQGLPQALGLYKSMLSSVKSLNVVLAQQEAAVNRQQAAVDKWKSALDAANAAIDAQQAKLESLQKNLDNLQAAYDAHQKAMENYASAPIAGMGAMSDAIFANEQAQKKLRLEMLKWEQVNGPIEDTQSKLAALMGDIETLRGQAADLRQAGAGSDITGPINEQIKAMEAQAAAMQNVSNNTPINEMQKQYDELQKQGEILQLQNDIKFDPLTRQIEKLVNTQKEMPYDQIVAGIKSEQAAMAALQPQIDSATAAVEKQKSAVDAATAARDAISARYDTEQAKLAQLKDAYDATEQTIRDIESALNDMGSAAQDNIAKAQEAANKLKSAKAAKDKGPTSPGAENFLAAAGASDFPNVAGTGGLGREGGLGDQSKQISDWAKNNAQKIKDAFGAFDPFKPIKDAWNKAWKWVEDNVTGPAKNVIDQIGGAFSGIHISIPNPLAGTSTWAKNAREIWATIQDVWSSAVGGLRHVWDLFKDDFSQIWDGIRNAFMRAWKKIGPELEKFREPLSGIGEAFKGLWTLLKPIIGLLAVGLFGAIKIVTSVLANVLGPVLNMVVDIITAVIKVFRGIITFLIGTFRGDLGQAIHGIVLIFGGMWDAIWAVFKGVGETLWGIVQGVVEGVVKWFKWLWDVLVGHSIVPDTIKAIVEWFAGLPKKAWDAVKDFAGKMKDRAVEAGKAFWDWITKKFTETIDWIGGLPKKAWDALIKLKDKLGDVADKAWDWFWTREKAGWSKIIGWLITLPKAAWDKMIDLKNKLGDVGKQAFDWLWSKTKIGWTTITNWLVGLPKNAWDKMIDMKNKLADVGTKAFDALFSKMKDMWNKKNGIIDWVKSLPQKVADALRNIGSTIAGALKTGWNSAAGWINDHGVDNVNKALKLFDVRIPRLPTFATGGIVPGKATRKDNTIIAARSGEGVIVPELVRFLGGAQGLKMLNGAAQRGQLRGKSKNDLPHFKDGGIVGKMGDLVGGIGDKIQDWTAKGTGYALDKILAPFEPAMRVLFPGRPFLEDWFVGVIKEWRAKAKAWGDNKDKALQEGGFGGGGDFGAHGANAKANQDIARRMLAGYGWGPEQMNPLIALWNGESGWNQFARNPSSGAYGIPQSLPAEKLASAGADWRTNPATQIRWGLGYIKSVYSTPANALMKWNARSPHWYDQGGFLKPGMTNAFNGTGKDELVLTHDAMASISNVLSMMDRVMAKSSATGTPGAATVRSMTATVTSLEARLRQQEAKASETTRSTSGTTTVNIYGDLVMPNIKSGDDADIFIRHLKTLAG